MGQTSIPIYIYVVFSATLKTIEWAKSFFLSFRMLTKIDSRTIAVERTRLSVQPNLDKYSDKSHTQEKYRYGECKMLSVITQLIWGASARMCVSVRLLVDLAAY